MIDLASAIIRFRRLLESWRLYKYLSRPSYQSTTKRPACCVLRINRLEEIDESTIRRLRGLPATCLRILIVTDDQRLPSSDISLRCDFVHFLPGDYLFGHSDLIRLTLAGSDIHPFVQDPFISAIIYGNLRYFYPLKDYFERHSISKVLLPHDITQLSVERTVLAAAKAADVPTLNYNTLESLKTRLLHVGGIMPSAVSALRIF